MTAKGHSITETRNNLIGEMTLYHTSDREIRNPDIHYGRKNADLGWGFYLSPDKDFIYRWAGKNAVVNEYELDTTGLDITPMMIEVFLRECRFRDRKA